MRKSLSEGSCVFSGVLCSDIPGIFEEYSMFPQFIIDQLSKGIVYIPPVCCH